ncbi:hypothetical protein FAGKG844_620023 [Frankia sp. AgKG'84/4]
MGIRSQRRIGDCGIRRAHSLAPTIRGGPPPRTGGSAEAGFSARERAQLGTERAPGDAPKDDSTGDTPISRLRR